MFKMLKNFYSPFFISTFIIRYIYYKLIYISNIYVAKRYIDYNTQFRQGCKKPKVVSG